MIDPTVRQVRSAPINAAVRRSTLPTRTAACSACGENGPSRLPARTMKISSFPITFAEKPFQKLLGKKKPLCRSPLHPLAGASGFRLRARAKPSIHKNSRQQDHCYTND
jgi:hypothetical protein